jgi:uncharacterized protein YyaL (SSP411 family)
MTVNKTLFALSLALTACAPPPRAPAPPATIAWHRFGPEAFEEARREGKLVLVDAGIEGCTACRWMHEGSYSDPEVIRRVSQGFVAVSVDADQQPDLGARFEPWGWPATVFFTPDGSQVHALEGSERALAFAKLLDELVAKQRAHALVAGAVSRASEGGNENLAAACLDVNARLEKMGDETGWGGRIRVAMAPPFEHALMRARSRRDAHLDARALAVGEGEAKILDPVWGGVFVVATTPTWDGPIPEKRTIHEAAALDTFALALHETGDPRWLSRANLVRKYLEDWMRAPDGTFYSTQQDDAPGLPEGMDAKAYYALDDAARRKYGIPPIDHGVYTDQNAAVIEAYVRLYEATGDAGVLGIATRAADVLLARRARKDGGFDQALLTPELAQDKRLRAKNVEDRLYLKAQGEMGLALLALHEATSDARYLDAARGIARALALLEDKSAGGFFATTARDTDALVARQKPLEDNLTAARFLARLSAVTRDATYAKTAERALGPALREVRGEGPWATGLAAVTLEELLVGPVEITIVRGDDGGRVRALHDAAVRIYEPRKIVRVEDPGHYPKPKSGAVAYVCTRTACSSPLGSADEIRAAAERMTVLGPDAVCSR